MSNENDRRPHRHHANTPEEIAAKKKRMETYAKLTNMWDEYGLDAQAIWNAKLRHSHKERVCALASHINHIGVAYNIKSLMQFEELYPMPALEWYETKDALKMAALSGAQVEQPDLVMAKVDDRGRHRQVVPRNGKNWEFVQA